MKHRIYRKLVKIIVGLIPAKMLYTFIYSALEAKSLSLDPKESIKKLFELDNQLYGLQGREAIRMENGIHPKHRILRYKEWFRNSLSVGDVVLDVGCNTGLLPVTISSKVSYVYGIEIEKEHIKKAKELHQKQNIEFICADATTYDYSQCKPIDCVTLSNVLEHIDQRVLFLQKIIKNLKWNDTENKRFLIRVPMLDRDWRPVLKKELGCEWRLDKTHYTEYTKCEFYQEMSNANIEVVNFNVRFGEIYAVCRAI